MKKILVFLLLVLFLFNTAGYYFIFEIRKYQVKEEMRSQIIRKTGELVILKIDYSRDRSGFEWLEDNEIRYQGSLYDVVRETCAGNTGIFYCIHDKKEENLEAVMKKVNDDKLLLSLWEHLIKTAFPHFRMQIPGPFYAAYTYPDITEALQSVPVKPGSPPPELS